VLVVPSGMAAFTICTIDAAVSCAGSTSMWVSL